MKLYFTCTEKELQCKVTITVPYHGEVTWTLGNQHTDKYYAAFVATEMRDQLQRALSTARQEAYEQGWKDAKGKKKKQDYFWGGWK